MSTSSLFKRAKQTNQILELAGRTQEEHERNYQEAVKAVQYNSCRDEETLWRLFVQVYVPAYILRLELGAERYRGRNISNELVGITYALGFAFQYQSWSVSQIRKAFRSLMDDYFSAYILPRMNVEEWQFLPWMDCFNRVVRWSQLSSPCVSILGTVPEHQQQHAQKKPKTEPDLDPDAWMHRLAPGLMGHVLFLKYAVLPHISQIRNWLLDCADKQRQKQADETDVIRFNQVLHALLTLEVPLLPAEFNVFTSMVAALLNQSEEHYSRTLRGFDWKSLHVMQYIEGNALLWSLHEEKILKEIPRSYGLIAMLHRVLIQDVASNMHGLTHVFDRPSATDVKNFHYCWSIIAKGSSATYSPALRAKNLQYFFEDLLKRECILPRLEQLWSSLFGPGAVAADWKRAMESLVTLWHESEDWIQKMFIEAEHKETARRKLVEAYRTVLDTESQRFPPLLARYLDQTVLNKCADANLPGATLDQNQRINGIVQIYTHGITERDLFQDAHVQLLQTRLLTGTCREMHLEHLVTGRLIAGAGNNWASNLPRLFNDMESTNDFNRKWKDMKEDSFMSMQTMANLNSGWPLIRETAFPSGERPWKWPSEIETEWQLLHNVFQLGNAGRRLTVLPKYCSFQMSMRLANRSITLSLDMFKASILLVMSASTSKVVELKDIMERLSITANQLAPHILSLCHPDCPILMKNPNEPRLRYLQDSAVMDKFMFNARFNSPSTFVNVPHFVVNGGVGVESKEDEQKLPMHVQQSRNLRIDAAIVRLLKTRQKMGIGDLRSEVVKQLATIFTVLPQHLSSRIDGLIAKEYIQRDDHDRRILHYVP